MNKKIKTGYTVFHSQYFSNTMNEPSKGSVHFEDYGKAHDFHRDMNKSLHMHLSNSEGQRTEIKGYILQHNNGKKMANFVFKSQD